MICEPATLAGMVALMDHLGEPEYLAEKAISENNDETVFSGAMTMFGDEVRDFSAWIADALRTLVGEAQS